MNVILDTMATSTLEREHGLILEVRTCMAVVADELDCGGKIEAAILQQFVEFFRVFVEGAHIRKEEAILFRALEKKGVPVNGCPLDLPRNEHLQGQALLADLSDSVSAYRAGEKGGASAVGRALRRLAAFYALHTSNEDHLLFPIANKFLSPDDQDTVYERFATVDLENGADFQARFRNMARELVRAVSDLKTSVR